MSQSFKLIPNYALKVKSHLKYAILSRMITAVLLTARNRKRKFYKHIKALLSYLRSVAHMRGMTWRNLFLSPLSPQNCLEVMGSYPITGKNFFQHKNEWLTWRYDPHDDISLFLRKQFLQKTGPGWGRRIFRIFRGQLETSKTGLRRSRAGRVSEHETLPW